MRSFCSTRNLTSLVSCLFFNIQHFFLLPYSVFYGWRTACIFIGHIMLESQHFGVWLQYLKSNFNLYQAKLARWEMKKKTTCKSTCFNSENSQIGRSLFREFSPLLRFSYISVNLCMFSHVSYNIKS